MPSPLPRALATLVALWLALPCLAADLTVSAASSLTNAFKELAPLFEAQHPETTLRLNLGASGSLLQQIAKGAPVDVFASADQETMDQAQARSLIDAQQRRDFTGNRLVVIVPAQGQKKAPHALADLAGPSYRRIAIGNPASVPVGRYAKGALERAGLWTSIEPKTLAAQNVRQALDYVARAEVDAGFVYATDAALMPDKVAVAFDVPTATPIRYPIAPVAGSSEKQAAREFIAFVLSPAAQGVLARYGFASSP